jgi:hypothetical protein
MNISRENVWCLDEFPAALTVKTGPSFDYYGQ